MNHFIEVRQKNVVYEVWAEIKSEYNKSSDQVMSANQNLDLLICIMKENGDVNLHKRLETKVRSGTKKIILLPLKPRLVWIQVNKYVFFFFKKKVNIWKYNQELDKIWMKKVLTNMIPIHKVTAVQNLREKVSRI